MTIIRRPFFSLKVLCIIVIIFVIIYSKHLYLSDRNALPERASRVNSTLPSTIQLNKYFKDCQYHNVFQQDEINRICTPSTADSPVCKLARIDHLNQRDFRLAELNLSGAERIKIMLHPSRDYISNSIATSGRWEGSYVDTLLKAIQLLPGAALLDIGANLGVYSLSAAHKGTRVVAIDANYQNAIRLFKSVEVNNLHSQVQIYWNALANETGLMKMRLPFDCNVGGGFPTDILQSHWYRDPIEVRAIGLDQIVLGRIGQDFLKDTRQLLIKMDIEGCEWGVMATAVGTFRRYSIPLVLMEWRGTQVFHPDKADFLLHFFVSRNYTAFNFLTKPLKELDLREEKKWPGMSCGRMRRESGSLENCFLREKLIVSYSG